MRLVLISGLSGSGKSVALKVLEDTGFYCIDNLPAPMLSETVEHLRLYGVKDTAVSIDARSGANLVDLQAELEALRASMEVRTLFLTARDETLVKRFSETRRRHPLASGERSLEECIREEREGREDHKGQEEVEEYQEDLTVSVSRDLWLRFSRGFSCQ